MARLSRPMPPWPLRARQPVSAGPREMTEKELAHLRSHRDRQERYIRTALFVQSKWFMVIGAAAIALFLLAMVLIAS